MNLAVELLALPTFETTSVFYKDNPRREHSPEWDYGVHWVADEPFPRWRVSWIVETGDVYACRQSGAVDPVILLGNVPSAGPYPYGKGAEAWSEFLHTQGIEAVLKGWAEVQPPTLTWVLDRLRDAGRAQVEP